MKKIIKKIFSFLALAFVSICIGILTGIVVYKTTADSSAALFAVGIGTLVNIGLFGDTWMESE